MYKKTKNQQTKMACQILSYQNSFLIFWFFFIIFTTSTMTTSVAAFDSFLNSGKLQSCSNEGEEVRIESIQNSRCFKCICQNGFVNCEKESCPSIEDCYVIEKKSSTSCCSKCKECVFKGTNYLSGDEWTDPDDSCIHYKCVAGVITETTMQCYTQCTDPLPPRPGECCPTCFGCHLNGQKVHDGREVTLLEDPCLKCHCSDKKLTCLKKACPVLQCPVSKQVKRPNECCPKCSEQKEIFMNMVPSNRCMFGKNLYLDRTQFEPDLCSTCFCENKTSVCHRNTCPVLECSIEFQKTNPGDCCPHCPPVLEARSSCTYQDKIFQNNETWKLGPCRSCRCYGGEIRCAQTQCPPIKCKPNESMVTSAEQCCPKCVESAGTCTVFGDPHYKTFDGKFFSFQGSCKYQLTADCRDQTFSIRVTNEARNSLLSSWVKTVTLKLKGTRVNLGQKLRVKVNGTRVTLPYKHVSGISVERITEGLILKTEQGIQIEWDGNNFLQIQIPSTYKNKLCGLCGNYNGIVRDDLTSRDSSNHSDQEVWRFANSWKVGGPKACSRKRENIAKQPNCKRRKSQNDCQPLRDSQSVFGDCDSRLNPINYFEACRMDMCECPHGVTCQCDSFAAYAHECKRLGVVLPNWRKATKCPLGNLTRSHFPRLNAARLEENIPEVFQHNRLQQKRRKTTRRPEHYYVPKALLISKPAGRTPPPLH